MRGLNRYSGRVIAAYYAPRLLDERLERLFAQLPAIHEWQAVPEVLSAVKRAVDEEPRPGGFHSPTTRRCMTPPASTARPRSRTTRC